MRPVTAIVMAGGDSDNKALWTLAGQSMLARVLTGLNNPAVIERIIVAGPTKLLAASCRGNPLIELIEGGDKVTSTAMKVVASLTDQSAPVLFVAADAPFLTITAVEDFLRQCGDRAADLYYPVVAKANYERRYPGWLRTYAPLKEGKFTGGNLVLMRPSVIAPCAAQIEHFFALRKQTLKLAHLIGWRFLLKFALRQLSMAEAATRFSTLMAIKAVVVVSEFPEIAADVDKPRDLLAGQRFA